VPSYKFYKNGVILLNPNDMYSKNKLVRNIKSK